MSASTAEVRRDRLSDYLVELPNFLTVFILAFFYFSLGPILIDISKDLRTTVQTLLLFASFQLVGNLVGTLTAPFLTRVIPRIRLIVIWYVLLMVMTLAFIFMPKSVLAFYILYFLAGYILGTLFVQANAYIQESKAHNKARLQTVAWLFFPLGCLAGPWAAILVVENGLSWRYVYVIVLVFEVINLVIYLTSTRRKDFNTVVGSAATATQKSSVKEWFGSGANVRNFLPLFIMMILFGAVEDSMANWAPSYLRVEHGFDLTLAGLVATFYWGGAAVGRLVQIALERKSMNYYLLVSACLATAAVILLAVGPVTAVILLCVGVVGAGLSPIAPSAMTKGSRVIAPGVAVALCAAGGAIGGALNPYIVRFVANRNFGLSIWVAVVLTALVIVAAFAELRRGRNEINGAAVLTPETASSVTPSRSTTGVV